MSGSASGAGADRRPVFVFQHGLGADASQPAALVPEGAPFRVATLDCPGHGASPHGRPAPGGGVPTDTGPRAPSIAAFAGDVAAFAGRETAASGGPWVLGGVSMGAAIALRLAARAFGGARELGIPRPAALVLVRPAWAFAAAPPNMAPFVDLADFLRRHGAERGAQAFAESATFQGVLAASPDNARSLLAQFRRPQAVSGPLVTADMLEAIARDGPGVGADEARALAVPTLVVGCPEDLVHPLGFARELAGAIPDARLVEVASKSADPERHAREVRGAIGAFLARVAA